MDFGFTPEAVNDHRLKAVASSYGLKPDLVGPKGRLALPTQL